MLRAALQALPNKRVLVVAHENITNNYYAGNNRSCLVSNCLFRVGGAACMLSNKCAPPHARSLVGMRVQHVDSTVAELRGAVIKAHAALHALSIRAPACHSFLHCYIGAMQKPLS